MLERYLRHRRAWEVTLWAVWWFGNATANSVVGNIDARRLSASFDWWEPVIWEFSSAVMLFALVPAQLAFERRFPFRSDTWRKVLPWHLLATVVYSLIHVLGMVALRHVAYDAMGEVYRFGHWPTGLFYEYLKDVRTYAVVLGFIYLYRLLLLRLQGEVRLLSAPDTGPPVEALERPERFLVRKLGSEFLIAARDIEWLEAAENYVNLHVRGRVYPLRSTMTAIQERLDPSRFVRVHRSYIVNLDFPGDARLVLRDGTRIPCSRGYRSALRARGKARRCRLGDKTRWWRCVMLRMTQMGEANGFAWPTGSVPCRGINSYG